MITVTINNKPQQFDEPEDTPLLWVIRDYAGLTGTKFGCGAGLCGACTVHLDGEAVRSCQTSLADAAGAKVTTIEHIGTTASGARVQQAWQEVDVPQCGYCQPGQIMAASALLEKNSKPSEADIDDAMEGNLCRCGTYHRIKSAIQLAATK